MPFVPPTPATENNKGAFLKAMIKISHPDWTAEQVESEFQQKLNQLESGDSSGCESCSG